MSDELGLAADKLLAELLAYLLQIVAKALFHLQIFLEECRGFRVTLELCHRHQRTKCHSSRKKNRARSRDLTTDLGHVPFHSTERKSD